MKTQKNKHHIPKKRSRFHSWMTWGLLIAAVITFGDCRMMKWHRASISEKADMIVDKINDELELNETQLAKLQKIKAELVAKFKSTHDAVKTDIHPTIIAEIKSSKMDVAKIREKMVKHKKDKQAMMDFALEKAAEFHQILTPAQRNKMAELVEEFHKRRGKRRH